MSFTPAFGKRFDKGTASAGGTLNWMPSNLDTPPAMWLDASTLNWANGVAQDFITLNTSPDPDGVSQWDDRSGSNNVVQATEANQPGIIVSGNRYVHFNGDAGKLLRVTGLSYSQPNTVAILFSLDSATDNDSIFDGDASGRMSLQEETSSGGVFKLFAGGDLQNTDVNYDITDYHMMMTGWSGGGSTIFYDGTAGTVGNPGSDAIDTISVGNNKNGNGGFDGRFIDFIFIDGTLSTDDRQLIEGYFAWKLNDQYLDSAIVTALPGGHPYKAAAPTV